jgi:NCS1 family nucleobase:cation symporter-1
MTALVLGIAPNVPGFLGAVKVLKGDPTMWDAIYPYAWFTGFLLAGVVYLGMTAVLKSPRNSTGTPG